MASSIKPTQTNLNILQANHLEHFKSARDLAQYLPLGNHRRVDVEKNLNELQHQILLIKQNI